MAKYLGFLYFDTNALMKYFLPKEKGADIVKFLIQNKCDYNHISYTSQIASYEIKQILKRKVSKPENDVDYISRDDYHRILGRIRRTLKQVIRIIDEKKVIGKKKFSYLDIMRDTSLTEGDARHWASVLNYLKYYFKNDIKVVNSDKRFNKFIRKNGFLVINPEKTTRKTLEKLLK